MSYHGYIINVVFVGDQPSRLNLVPGMPFIGASCFERLVSWIKVLSTIDFYTLCNSNTQSDLTKIKKLHSNGFRVVALGQTASKRLELQQIPHFTLPHPSGLNRQTNDKQSVNKKLIKCNVWIVTQGAA